MFTKRQKKLLSHAMRDFVKHGKYHNLVSISDSWHRVRCPYDDESSCDYGLLEFDSLDDALNWCYECEENTRRALPLWDCSGKAFISHTHVGMTNIPNVYAIILYWSLDI